MSDSESSEDQPHPSGRSKRMQIRDESDDEQGPGASGEQDVQEDETSEPEAEASPEDQEDLDDSQERAGKTARLRKKAVRLLHGVHDNDEVKWNEHDRLSREDWWEICAQEREFDDAQFGLAESAVRREESERKERLYNKRLVGGVIETQAEAGEGKSDDDEDMESEEEQEELRLQAQFQDTTNDPLYESNCSHRELHRKEMIEEAEKEANQSTDQMLRETINMFKRNPTKGDSGATNSKPRNPQTFMDDYYETQHFPAQTSNPNTAADRRQVELARQEEEEYHKQKCREDMKHAQMHLQPDKETVEKVQSRRKPASKPDDQLHSVISKSELEKIRKTVSAINKSPMKRSATHSELPDPYFAEIGDRTADSFSNYCQCLPHVCTREHGSNASLFQTENGDYWTCKLKKITAVWANAESQIIPLQQQLSRQTSRNATVDSVIQIGPFQFSIPAGQPERDNRTVCHTQDQTNRTTNVTVGKIEQQIIAALCIILPSCIWHGANQYTVAGQRTTRFLCENNYSKWEEAYTKAQEYLNHQIVAQHSTPGKKSKPWKIWGLSIDPNEPNFDESNCPSEGKECLVYILKQLLGVLTTAMKEMHKAMGNRCTFAPAKK